MVDYRCGTQGRFPDISGRGSIIILDKGDALDRVDGNENILGAIGEDIIIEMYL